MGAQGKDVLRIGIDVGGTNTDAVLMLGRQVLAETKQSTTADVTGGVISAVSNILSQSGTAAGEVGAVMVGTTHFVNAFVQRRELQEVAVVRVGLPMTSGIPPMVDWPEDLRGVIGENVYMVDGGCYYTGEEYRQLDAEQLRLVAQEISSRGITAIALSSVFAPIRPDIETQAANILRAELEADTHITLSHQVGGLGLVERENAAIINATLHSLAAKVVSALREALTNVGIDAALYFSQNDGTLMDAVTALEFPVTTCAAGPTNSIRGAAFLSEIDNAIVVDVGGTTSDVGVLHKGFARETSSVFEIGGVRTNFSIPDTLSVALGGGTLVRRNAENEITLGPDSVGFRLQQTSRVFGGGQLTTTDVVVARRGLEIGDATLVADLEPEFCAEVDGEIRSCIEAAIDQIKVSAADVPVILVGGGSILIDGALQGASDVIKPDHGAVANAIGAAIAQVGGRVKRLFDYKQVGGRDAALEKAVELAKENAVSAGAMPDSLQVVEIEEYPMPYMQTDAVDVHVLVVGDLDQST